MTEAAPTPDEFAAMDLGALSADEQQAFLRAAMTTPRPAEGDAARFMHVRRPHWDQDSGYHTSSSGHVYSKLNAAPARTFCGAEPGLDLGYDDIARRRADYDWGAQFANLPENDAAHGVTVCEICIAEALKVKEQRAAERAQKRKKTR